MQKKDVIYIDVEDDITAIIGKVKDAKEKIVALVPPKRVGVLQSAVNLRLLSRVAGTEGKRIVIITGNAALAGLAASAKIPVAKTLQSRPEIAEIPALKVDDDDVIDGEKLPVGDHARMAEDSDADTDEEDIPPSSIKDLNIDGEAAPTKAPEKKPKEKRGIKVPDFGTFRKKLVLGISGGVLLVAFLVWAIWFAPQATVVVTARTSDVSVKTPVAVGDNLEVDAEKMTIPSITETETKTDSIEFEATGEKEVGEKASGTVKLYNCSLDAQPKTVQAGTYISSGGMNYIVQATVVVPEAVFPGSGCSPGIGPGVSADVKVVAEDLGPDFNISSGTSFEVAGRPDITAVASSDIDGGSKKTVTVVSAQDVEKALEDLTKGETADDVKKALLEKFGDDVAVIESSFKANTDEQNVTPKMGEEVSSGKAKLSVEVTYSMIGIAKSDLDEFLKSAIEAQLGEIADRRIYESGADSASLEDYQHSDDKKKATVQLSATGQVGPKIEDSEIKEIVKGKRFGEIQADLKAIDGVSDVDVRLSPFWVSTVPDDDDKITIEFKLKDNG